MNITTAVSKIENGETIVRGERLHDLANNSPFHEAIFLLLTGEHPTKEQSELFSMMLVSAIDHGAQVPSVIAARMSFSGSGQVNSAVAAGVNTFGAHHGGAIEGAARIYHDYLKEHTDADAAAEHVLEDYIRRGGRVPGYGHKIFKDKDPRVVALQEKAGSLNLSGQYTRFALVLENAIATEKKKRIPLNIDGGLAALLLDLGFPVEAALGFFIIARTPGIVAHVIEEAIREKPFRRLEDDEVVYDGK